MEARLSPTVDIPAGAALLAADMDDNTDSLRAPNGHSDQASEDTGQSAAVEALRAELADWRRRAQVAEERLARADIEITMERRRAEVVAADAADLQTRAEAAEERAAKAEKVAPPPIERLRSWLRR